MTPRAALTRATIASAVALIVAMLKALGVEVPTAIANDMIEVAAYVAPLAAAWYAARVGRAMRQANARPTEGDAPDATATPGATPSDPVAIVEGDNARTSPTNAPDRP